MKLIGHVDCGRPGEKTPVTRSGFVEQRKMLMLEIFSEAWALLTKSYRRGKSFTSNTTGIDMHFLHNLHELI